MARFKVDENLPMEVAGVLREAGHDAVTVGEQQLGGEADPAIAAVCRIERRTLLTLDTDFADLRAYPPESAAGIVVLRLRRQDRAHVVAVVTRLLPRFEEEPLAGFLWIVDEERIRIRGAGPPACPSPAAG